MQEIMLADGRALEGSDHYLLDGNLLDSSRKWDSSGSQVANQASLTGAGTGSARYYSELDWGRNSFYFDQAYYLMMRD